MNRIQSRFANQIGSLLQSKKPQNIVGLDVGSGSIKLIELRVSPQGIRVLRHHIQELPISNGEEPVDPLESLQIAIKEFGAREVYVQIDGRDVAVRRVRVPPMPANELPEAVKWQVKEQLPFPIQDVVLDFAVTGEFTEKGIKKLDVLVVAAPRSYVQERIALIESAGAKVVGLTPTPIALWQSMLAILSETQDESVAIIELGASSTQVTIIAGGQVRIVRELALGCSNMTEALMGVVASESGEITINRSRAEELKREYGVLSESEEGSTKDGVPLFHIASLLRPVLENLITELQRLFAFYRMQLDETGISRVLLCGGGANLKSLEGFLSERLDLTVELFNPMVKNSDQQVESETCLRLVTAIGLAVHQGTNLSLLPEDRRRFQAQSKIRVVMALAGKGLAAVALVVLIGMFAVSGVLHAQIRSQEKIWKTLESQYNYSTGMVISLRTLNEEVKNIERFINDQPLWEGVLKEIGELMPKSMVLDEIMFGAQLWDEERVEENDEESADEDNLSQPMRGRATGKVISAGIAAEGNIGQFIKSMNQSSFFKDVRLVSSEIRSGGSGRTTFEIEWILE